MISMLQSIPALWRKRIYLAYGATVVLIGAIQAGLATANAGTPTYLKVAISIVAYLGGALGLTAGVNVNEEDGPPPAPADGGLDVSAKPEPHPDDDPKTVAGKGTYTPRHAR